MNDRSGIEVGNGICMDSDTWRFGEAAKHFDEHIAQSVPRCQEQREFIAGLARFFLHEGAQAYEIGVSTGRTAEAILSRVPGRQVNYTGIDLAPEMVAFARRNLQSDPRFSAVCADALQFAYQPAALIVSYYTLQFLPLTARQTLLARLYGSLQAGGALLMYEKTLGAASKLQDLLAQLYHEFKSQQGLDAAAILNKERALQGVAMPLTLEDNLALLKRTGFAAVEIVFREHCFAGFLALKD